MLSPRLYVPLLAGLSLLQTGASLAGKAPSGEDLVRARAKLEHLVQDSRDPAERARRIAHLVWREHPGGALQQVAEEALRSEIGNMLVFLPQFFFEGDALIKAAILDFHRENWQAIGKGGGDSWTTQMVRHGLESPDWSVRRAAARLIAFSPVQQVAHFAIDAAEAEPIFTQAALMSIAVSQDEKGAGWATTHLSDPDPAIRAAALRAVFFTRERAKLFLKEQLDSPEPAVRHAALEAWLLIVHADDLPTLQGWLEKNQAKEPAQAEKVARVLALAEIGRYTPVLPELPALEIPEKPPRAKVRERGGQR